LSKNTSEGAMQLLEKNRNKINWVCLSKNPSESAMQLLEKNLYQITNICWDNLSMNPSALQFLKKNQNKINWRGLSMNPHIFKYDYIQMKHNCMVFKEELIQNRYHPRNISKFKDWKVNAFEFDSDSN